jgi:hypothetical protein
MRYLLGCLCAVGLAFTASMNLSADDKGNLVTLTGCLIHGDHGYLLTNAPDEPRFERADAGKIEPGPVGTSGAGSSIFYWLDDDHDLAKNIGHQVEIQGELKGDVKPGEIKIDRKRNWTTIEIKSQGRSLKADVPERLWVVSPRGVSDEDKVNTLVRRVDPKHVRMLAVTCE